LVIVPGEVVPSQEVPPETEVPRVTVEEKGLEMVQFPAKAEPETKKGETRKSEETRRESLERRTGRVTDCRCAAGEPGEAAAVIGCDWRKWTFRNSSRGLLKWHVHAVASGKECIRNRREGVYPGICG
jgi:hypothetical protein